MSIAKRLAALAVVLLLTGACATMNSDPAASYSTRELQEMGEKFLAAGDLAQALKFLTLAEQREPNNEVVQYQLGLAYAARAFPTDAQQHLERAITLKPDYSDAYNALGAFFAEQGQDFKAKDAFERAIANPFYATPQFAYYNLGQIYEKEGDLETALKQYQLAVRLQHNYGLAYYRMGQVLEALKRGDEAKQAYGKAIEFAPDLVEAHFRFGVMSYLAGELENSLYSLSRVVKLAPHSTMAIEARHYLEKLQNVLGPDGQRRGAGAEPLRHLEVMSEDDVTNQAVREYMAQNPSPPATKPVASPPAPAASVPAPTASAPAPVPAPAPPAAEQTAKPSGDPPESEAPASTPPPSAPPSNDQLSSTKPSTEAPSSDQASSGQAADESSPAPAPPPTPKYTYTIQVNSFLDKENAEAIQKALKEQGYTAVVKPIKHQVLGTVYVVQLKPVSELSKASTIMTQIEQGGQFKPILIKTRVNP